MADPSLQECVKSREHISPVRRWLAACGIAVVAMDTLVLIVLGALDPGYSHAWQYISELGEEGRPFAWVFNAWCIAYGLLFAGFAVVLGRGLRSRPLLVVLLVVAVTSAVSGVFPCDPGCAGQTSTARMHILNGYVGLIAILLTPFFAWFAVRARPEWRGYRALTLASGGLLLVAIGWLAACHYGCGRGHEACPVGTIQRLFLGIQDAWVVVMAVRLWRSAQPATKASWQRR